MELILISTCQKSIHKGYLHKRIKIPDIHSLNILINFITKLTAIESIVYITTQIKKVSLKTLNIKIVKTINVNIGITNHFLTNKKPMIETTITAIGKINNTKLIRSIIIHSSLTIIIQLEV
jgi:hypothetical protein